MDTREVVIGALIKERDDWRDIYGAYLRNEKDGEKLHAGKESRCGLCPDHQTYYEGGSNEYLSCRTCPIVILTRRTCAHWWEIFDVAPEQKDRRAALKTYLFLKKLIEKVN